MDTSPAVFEQLKVLNRTRSAFPAFFFKIVGLEIFKEEDGALSNCRYLEDLWSVGQIALNPFNKRGADLVAFGEPTSVCGVGVIFTCTICHELRSAYWRMTFEYTPKSPAR